MNCVTERLDVGEEFPIIRAIINQIHYESFISTYCLKCIYLFTKKYILPVQNVPDFLRHVFLLIRNEFGSGPVSIPICLNVQRYRNGFSKIYLW